VATDDATARGSASVGTPAWQRIGMGILAEHVPADLVDQVLADTGRVQRRVRRLPSRVVVWFVLALALFGGEGYRSVWRHLVHSDPDRRAAPSSSGLSQARRRLGVAPLAGLFARLRGPQALPGAAGAFLAGLRLVAWDGTTVDVPDSDANAAAFIRPSNTRGVGAFPKVRLVTLIECGTHAVIDAVFGHESEQVLTRRLLGSLGEGMLLLADRNFPSHTLWREAAATGAHLLWRIKANTLLPRIGTFPDGSWLAVLPRPGTGRRQGTWVRVIEYQVTVTATDPHGAATTRTELFRLITTITDPAVASAAELASCYHQRWESETGYKALKTHQRGPRQVLRSQDPDGVTQELFAYLITYQALRRLMHHAATTAAIDPDRLSFTTTLRAVRRWIISAATATGTILADVIAEILQDQHQRRDRVSPRVVKRSQAPYPSRKHTTQPTSATADYAIQIIHSGPT
jgi:hypothetical protein